MTVSLSAAAAFLGVASSLTAPMPGPETMIPPASPPSAQAQSAPAAMPVPPAAPSRPALSTGPYTLHLASYRSRDNAVEGWRKLSQAAAALAGLQPDYHPVDVPGRGVFVRLTAGRFADKAAAQTFCESIRAVAGYCQPLKA